MTTRITAEADYYPCGAWPLDDRVGKHGMTHAAGKAVLRLVQGVRPSSARKIGDSKLVQSAYRPLVYCSR